MKRAASVTPAGRNRKKQAVTSTTESPPTVIQPARRTRNATRLAESSKTEVTNQPARENRKRQAVTKTTDSSTIAKIKNNALQSPLVSLPGEIREKILKLLIANKIIHVVPAKREYNPLKQRATSKEVMAITHTICVAACVTPNMLIQEEDDIPRNDDQDCYVQTYAKCHEACLDFQYVQDEGLEGKELRKYAGPTLPIPILGVCRQLYEEANHLLWSTNTFSFDNQEVFNVFLKGLNPAQKRNMRKVSLSVPLDETVFAHSPKTLQKWGLAHAGSASTVALKAIKVLDLYLHFKPASPWSRYGGRPSRRTLEQKSKPIRQGFASLQALCGLDLEEAVVTISDQDYTWKYDDLQDERLNVAQKRALAEDFRAQILDAAGIDVVKSKDEDEKEQQKAKQVIVAPMEAEKSQRWAQELAGRARRWETRAQYHENLARGIQDTTHIRHTWAVTFRQRAEHMFARAKRSKDIAEQKQARAEKLNPQYRKLMEEKRAKSAENGEDETVNEGDTDDGESPGGFSNEDEDERSDDAEQDTDDE